MSSTSFRKNKIKIFRKKMSPSTRATSYRAWASLISAASVVLSTCRLQVDMQSEQSGLLSRSHFGAAGAGALGVRLRLSSKLGKKMDNNSNKSNKNSVALAQSFVADG